MANDVECILEEAKKLISSNKVIFTRKDEKEREKNQKFLNEFEISERGRLEYFLQLTADDHYVSQLDKLDNATLYSFGKKIKLRNKYNGNEENIAVYMKFKIIRKGEETLVICSFHEAEFDIQLMNKRLILKERS